MTVHDVAAALPDIPTLRDRCRAIAMLEAMLNPDDVYRYYSFNRSWSATQEIASMRNGSGDEFDVIFSPAGAYIRGFDHESPMSPYANDEPWPGVVASVPDAFRSCVDEPAFSDDGMPRVTACLWQEAGGGRWQAGEIDFPEGEADPDGSGWLFELLVDPSPEAFQGFVEDYYERAVDIDAVRHVYEFRPLNREALATLNGAAHIAGVVEAARAIGYPLSEELATAANR